MKFKLLHTAIWFWTYSQVLASTIPVDKVSRAGVKLIENLGQWEDEVLFKAHIPGGDFYITKTGYVYSLIETQNLHEILHHNSTGLVRGHNFRVTLEGAKTPVVRKFGPSAEYYNYFLGNNPTKWKSGCRAYERIVLEGVYTGIDIEVIAMSDRIKLNYLLKPLANPALIKLKYEGINTPDISSGKLEMETTLGSIIESLPVSFQPDLGSDSIYTAYTFENGLIGFSCKQYNPLFKLVIDPEIIFGTYSGSVADNFGFTATYDLSGNGYAGGTVYAAGFPTTLGAFQRTFNGGDNQDGNFPRDCGILKFNANGTDLMYCTYIGGSANEQPHSMVCAPNGDLVIFGTTRSANFPTTSGAFSQIHRGNFDMFIARLNAAGSALVASTLVGGTQDDGINGTPEVIQYNPNSTPLKYNFADQYRGEVIIDRLGNIVIGACTKSSIAQGFPISNGFQNVFGGVQDGVLMRFNGTLSQLQFCSYLGGTTHDAIYSVVTDNLNNYIITGGSNSTNLPAALGFEHKGGVDAFVAKISSTGNLLTRLIYIGTPSYDQSYFVQLDSRQRVYITGQTESNFFPTAGNGVFRNIGAKHFVSILSPNLDTLLISTTFGKTGTSKPALSPSAFLVDICNRIYFSGWGGGVNSSVHMGIDNTTGLPITSDAFQQNTDGSDFYLIVFNPDLKGVAYASYIGDPFSEDHVDGGTSRFDPEGIVYQSVCAGCNNANSQFPTTPGAWSRINAGKRPNSNAPGCNNALFKMSLNVSMFPPEMKDTLLTVIAEDSLVYTAFITDRDNDSLNSTWVGTLLFSEQAPNIQLLRNRGENRLTIRFKPSCNQINDTLWLRVLTTDNACPVERIDTGWIRIVVLPPIPSIVPHPECLTYINSHTARIVWQPIQDPNTDSIFIYRSKNGSPYNLIHKSSDRFDTLFIDTTAIDHQFDNYCYYLATSYKCNGLSGPSRTICSIFKDDTIATPAFIFSRDTIIYINATDTLLYSTDIFDTDPLDSVKVVLLNAQPGFSRFNQITTRNNLGSSRINLELITSCDDVGDTIFINYLVVDNQCPTPRNDLGKIRIVVLPPPTNQGPTFQCLNRINENQLVVGFANYEIPKYHNSLRIIRKNPDGTIVPIADNITGSSFSITDNAPAHNTKDYCYAAIAINICGFEGDTTPFVCSINKPEEFPDGIDILNVTVVNNESIKLIWAASVDTSFTQYTIYRSLIETPANRTRVASINTIDSLSYIDNSVTVNKHSYCYYITQTNACGLESMELDTACSILLKGINIPFEHKLNWNPYTYWPLGAEFYDVERIEPGLSPVMIGRTMTDKQNFTDNRLNIDNGLYFYTISAVEFSKSVAPFISQSNTIELIQKPLLYVPNAFTPNQDQTNDQWKPRPVFVKEYDLKLYDRWGKLVFSTDDKYNFFNGESEGNIAATDAYVYVIHYTGWDGSANTTKGTVTILR